MKDTNPKPDLEALISEGRNPRTRDIDQLPTLEMLRLINAEDAGVAGAVGAVLPAVAEAVERIVEAFRQGGRLIYLGAGTSGRLGVLDASECPPTFGVDAGMVVGLIAGGPRAVTDPIEGAEDDPGLGRGDLQSIALTGRDVVVGIAASGRTPYVIGGVEYARAVGAVTIALTCNPGSMLSGMVDIAIEPEVGPEVLTGSTRLKSGTAQKLVLNMMSTGAMIRLGKTFGNLMVDVQTGNAKLAARAERIVAQATGCDLQRAEELMALADGSVKLAILIELADIDVQAARVRLDAAGGVLRIALQG